MRIAIISVIIILFSVSACVQPPAQKTYPKKVEVKNSATTVVSDFLEALKNRNFKSAYKHVYIINSDEEGYINRFESIYNEYDLKIVNYKVLGTQLYKETAIVVAEVQVNYKNPSEEQRLTTVYRNQYDLAVIENMWKITKDKCIQNCRDTF